MILSFAFILLVSLSGLPQSQVSDSVYDRAATAFQDGKLAEAEETLRSMLRSRPDDVRALGMLGVVLDAQKRFDEAERYYVQALRLAPGAAALHNNMGNHYLARGLPERARASFQRALSLDPHHPNANLHLAQMSVDRKEGQVALRFLDRLPAAEQRAPPAQLLRARALYLAGKKESSEALLTELAKQASGDSRLAFSIGMIFVKWGRFEQAEKAFNEALEAAPTNFDVLYNLGLAATWAGHLDRAEQVFEAALRQRSDDVDCLLGLAQVYGRRSKDELAAACLVRAEHLAPDRLDVLLLLAHTSEKLGFYGDTASAYDRYLKHRPDDDSARRERGFALVRSGKLKGGLPDLEWYVQKHPDEVDGLYKLALAEVTLEREKALAHLTKSLQIDPRFLPARYARAALYYEAGQAAEAMEELKHILQQTPDHALALDLLGQCHLLIEQPAEAVKVLSRAAELAPKDSRILIHYSRALRRAGRKDEAEAMLVRFKQIGPDPAWQRPRAGLFDYLSLSPAEQRAQNVTALQRSIAANPEDVGLKVRLGKVLLAGGDTAAALAIFDKVADKTSDGKLLSDCGAALLEYEQYEAARRFLEAAAGSPSSTGEVRLDLAIAISHVAGATAALEMLDNVPPDHRKGDYYLLRAQLLDSVGRVKEAAEALNRAFQAAPTRADLYFQAALFLIKHEQYDQAEQILQQANRFVPEVPELMLTHAIALELMKEPEKAKQVLSRMQSRWPEWDLPYLLHGIILEARLFSEEAKGMLETAIALGARDPAAYYYLALATLHATPDDTEGVQKAVLEAVRLSPEDPFIRSLAGRNALTRKDYAAAMEHLNVALRNRPDMVEARYALSASYRGAGNHEQAKAELERAQQLEKETKQDDLGVSPVRELLFTLRPPRRNPP